MAARENNSGEGKTMRRGRVLLVAIALLAAAAMQAQSKFVPPSMEGPGDSVPGITVQISPPPISISSGLIGVSNPLGAQPVKGKPLFVEYITEHRQSFTDGNHIARATHSRLYRDGRGRIRRESELSVPGLPAGAAPASFVTVANHQTGYGFVLNPQEMVAHRYELNRPAPSYVARLSAHSGPNPLMSGGDNPPPPDSHWNLHNFIRRMRLAENASIGGNAHGPASGFVGDDAGIASAPTIRIEQPLLAAPNPVRTENLGEQVMLGYRVKGTRVITTLPAGQIGNDRPIDIVSEQWFSSELERVMRSLHRDPWAGEFTTTVTHLDRGEPSEELFEVPPDYKVVDAADEHEHHVLQGNPGPPPGQPNW